MIFQDHFIIDISIQTFVQIMVFIISTLLVWIWAKQKEWNDSIKPSVIINLVWLILFYILYISGTIVVLAYYLFILPLDLPGIYMFYIFILITFSIIYFIIGILIASWKYEVEIKTTVIPILVTVIVRAIASGLIYIVTVMILFP